MTLGRHPTHIWLAICIIAACAFVVLPGIVYGLGRLVGIWP